LAFSIQLLTRPEHVGDGQLIEASILDRLRDVDLNLDLLLVAVERRATEVAAGPKAER
jgi:hypothetical protein